MTCKLAILIPAYKIDFLQETLTSISNQTCKHFKLYIGDDASPKNLYSIIHKFEDKIDIIYKRFDKNFGSTDLVAHWNRCVDLIQDEEWVWLFSDDDLMENNCVELFYKHIERHKNDILLHFNIQIIDEYNSNLFKIIKFQSNLSTMDFFSKRINNKILSMAVEYIFKKEAFEEVSRFQSFDLAWSSDDATWLKLSTYNGICTIDGALVKWRYSTKNISSILEDKEIVIRKFNATINYLNWSTMFFNQKNIVDITSKLQKARWLTAVISQTSSLNYSEKYQYIIKSLNTTNLNKVKLVVVLLWIYKELKKFLR